MSIVFVLLLLVIIAVFVLALTKQLAWPLALVLGMICVVLLFVVGVPIH